jgi:hypothetical protein
MKMKHLSAFVTLVALSLVAACSSGSGGVVPGASGITPAGASSAATEAQSDTAAAKASPIKLDPASLTFSLAGAMKSKRVVVTEAKYDGKFRITDTCRKHVLVSLKDAQGPKGSIVVTPVSAIASCTITVSDTEKNHAAVNVSIRTGVIPTATPSTSPSPTPTSSTTATPSANPSVSPTVNPSTSPTTSPSTAPTTSPSTAPGQVIANGNFSTGDLSGWNRCSFSHAGYTAAVNPSPTPAGTGTQIATSPIPALTLSTYGNSVGTPPPNLNANNSGAIPAAITGKAAMTGDQNSEESGNAGICQTFTVPAGTQYLSFYAYEGGSEYSFKYADQEADVLDSTGTTLKQTLFAEDNCFWDPGQVGATGYLNNGCIPDADGSISSHQDWQGGYWVQRGPYDLSAYAGQSITLFLGVWDEDTDNSPDPDTYSNEMWVTNVQMSSSDTFPTSYPFARHRAIQRRAPSTNHVHPPSAI